MRKIVIAGGNGFIGRFFASRFRSEGAQIIVISRSQGNVQWTDPKGIRLALENSSVLLNLAGRSVDCRYHARNKREILESRTETTRLLGQTLLKCQNPPLLWINSSTATIYRDARDRPMTEDSGEIGSGFSVGVAKSWEETFFSFALPMTRQIALRMAIVLGPGGGVMTPYQNLVRFGLGGPQGEGRQMFSWIHLEDLYRCILFLESRLDMAGVYNASSPNPVPNHVLMKTLRDVLGMPIGFPAPKWLLEMGALLIKTETELVLKSRWVIPKKLQEAGFVFQYPNIAGALNQIIHQNASE